MIKRVAAVAIFGLCAALAVPSVALAQDALGTSEEKTTTETPEGEPAGTEIEAVIVKQSVATEETGGEESDAPDTAAVEPQVASTEATSSSATTEATVTTDSVTIGNGGKKSKKASRARGKKSAKSCGSKLARASAPPAAGCTRLNGSNGNLVLPDGTTLVITSPSQGVMNFTVVGGPTGTFVGTIFVKGGPSDPGQPCVFTTPVTGGTCFAPVNPNNPNGNLFGVSHVDACPGAFTPPGTTGGGGGGRGGGQQQKKQQQKKKAAAQRRAVSAPVAAAAVAAPEGQLPVTGLPVGFLVFVGGLLVTSGLTLRRLT